jgi:hypothetical protein
MLPNLFDYDCLVGPLEVGIDYQAYWLITRFIRIIQIISYSWPIRL